ncbi:HIT domain-containing protein [Sessilibacter corallicola]|uniref:HIT domain-containing protein n=1 Tax=Sessilibacter corallicola TaxID=2904075 RepID=UPI001E6361A0|nr:HIT domain-containing protein [Sessilibacter corallicola]MCE2026885.1 HIT domain-containing protein [Sessilibacter corallicola]
MFTLDPILESDTVLIGHFSLSLVLLSKDSNYPWCILVPQKPNIREIFQLDPEDRSKLLEESCTLSETMVALFQPDKMNVAALGNMVPQLHLHHIARFKDDPAWPSPIWGAKAATPYTEEALAEIVSKLRSALSGDDFVISDEVPEPSSTFSPTIET